MDFDYILELNATIKSLLGNKINDIENNLDFKR